MIDVRQMPTAKFPSTPKVHEPSATTSRHRCLRQRQRRQNRGQSGMLAKGLSAQLTLLPEIRRMVTRGGTTPTTMASGGLVIIVTGVGQPAVGGTETEI